MVLLSSLASKFEKSLREPWISEMESSWSHLEVSSKWQFLHYGRISLLVVPDCPVTVVIPFYHTMRSYE